MMSTLNPHDDRDALSALFDGELHGDAARFALKRLAHDGQWRETCSRWQLAGDALRGQANAAAPSGFADGVSARLARESAPAPVVSIAEAAAAARRPVPAVVAAPRRRWIGGAALAASVAMAALFVTRPFSSGEPAALPPPVVAAGTAPAPVATPATAEAAPVVPAASLAVAGAVAVSDAPRRIAERRSRGQSQRAALRVQQRATGPAVVSAAAAEPVPVASGTPATPVDPFRPQSSDAIVTRPWPRAALPNFPAAGTLTASAGSSVASPSFYPFEPRLQAEGPQPGGADAAGPQP